MRHQRFVRTLVGVIGLSGTITLGSATQLSAQQLAVQQPVFGVNGVATTVVVPDRGRTSIGGVGRGASGQSRSGFAPAHRAFGTELSGSNMSVGVTIHDFAEMDARALATPVDGRTPRGRPHHRARSTGEPKLNARAEWAWQSLASRPAGSR